MPFILEMKKNMKIICKYKKKHIESSMIKCEFATFERDAGVKLLMFPGSLKLLASLLVLYDYSFIQNM